jgi:hypothetical protein
LLIPKKELEEIHGSETEYTEFKKSFESLGGEKLQDTILAFTNNKGGTIYIGVDEINKKDNVHHGKIVGIQNESFTKSEKLLCNWCKDYFIPPLVGYDMKTYTRGKKEIWAIYIKPSPFKPVCTKKGLYKIRIHSNNEGINPELMKKIIIREEEYIGLLIKELEMNKREIAHLLKNLNSNNNAKVQIPFSRMKSTTLNLFFNNPGLINIFDFGILEGLFHGYTILNVILDKFNQSVFVNQENQMAINGVIFNYYRDIFNAHGNDIMGQMDNLILKANEKLDKLKKINTKVGSLIA